MRVDSVTVLIDVNSIQTKGNTITMEIATSITCKGICAWRIGCLLDREFIICHTPLHIIDPFFLKSVLGDGNQQDDGQQYHNNSGAIPFVRVFEGIVVKQIYKRDR